MKKQTPAIAKKVFTFLLTLVIMAASSPAKALPDKGLNAKPFEISYKGLKNKLLFFKVDYLNEKQQPFQLLIRNDQNEVLYKRAYEGKTLSSEILLSELPENCKLTFTIESGNKKLSQSFEINKEIKTVEEFVVKGL